MLSIKGIGTDIVEISRFQDYKKDDPFIKKCYTQEEITYCFSKGNPAQHLAARFAAKEAVIKALYHSNSNTKIEPRQINITNDNSGVPRVGFSEEKIKENVFISMSHSNYQALAIAVLGP